MEILDCSEVIIVKRLVILVQVTNEVRIRVLNTSLSLSKRFQVWAFLNTELSLLVSVLPLNMEFFDANSNLVGL